MTDKKNDKAPHSNRVTAADNPEADKKNATDQTPPGLASTQPSMSQSGSQPSRPDAVSNAVPAQRGPALNTQAELSSAASGPAISPLSPPIGAPAAAPHSASSAAAASPTTNASPKPAGPPAPPPPSVPGMIDITIDGVPVVVAPGSTIIQAGQKVNKFIPHFCYHPGLSVVGQCRMCFVEIEGAPKLATACSTPVGQGMKILTESPKVKAGQNATLEFTLLHHPLDCPICDRGGECKLQDFTYEFGPPLSRMIEEKKEWDKHRPVSEQVILDQERCILCTRCVRFSSEVDGRAELVVNDRGSHNHIDVFDGRPMESKFSGNVVDLCPVGALTSKDFRFVARPWELRKHSAICTGCANGCNIDINTKHRHPGIARPDGSEPNPHLIRLLPRENLEINQWWMCDKGRWGYHFHNEDGKRLEHPQARRTKDSAPETLSLREIQLMIDAQKSAPWEFWIDDTLPHEGIAWAKELFKSWNDRGRKVSAINPAPLGDELLKFYASAMPTSPWIAGKADWKTIKTVVAPCDYRELEDIAPILALRLGQDVRKGLVKWEVRSADALHQAGDDLASTAYLVPAPKSAEHLTHAKKLPAGANFLFLWTYANTRGLMNEGIAPIETIGNTLTGAPKGPVFFFGQRTQNALSPALAEYLAKAPFLVVADSFASALTAKADIVLPLTPLWESRATLTSLENHRQLSPGVNIDHPNYAYLHRGGAIVAPALRLI